MRRPTQRLIRAALALLIAAGPSLAAAQSMFRGDAVRSGVQASPAPRSLARVKWSFPTADRVVSSPVWQGGTLYFGSDDGNVYAVDATSGFGSGDGHVYALDAASGEQRWKFHAGEVVHASPAVVDGVVYVGAWDSRLYAIDLRSGQERWRFQAGVDAFMHNQQGFQSSPAVLDGVLYVGCRDAHLYAIDAQTGKERWRYPTGASWVVGSPAVKDGRVYFATSDSSLVHAFDAATGQPLWQQQAKAYMFSSPSIAGEVLLIGLLNGTLEARDLASGAALWSFRTEASRANRGWALTADSRLNAPMLFTSGWREAMALGFERQSGVGSIFSTPLVVDGVVYVGSADGRLYALE